MKELMKIVLKRIMSQSSSIVTIKTAEELNNVTFLYQQELIEVLLAAMETGMTREEFFKAANEAYLEVCA